MPDGAWKAVVAQGRFEDNRGRDVRRLRLVPHRQLAAALSRRAPAALPPSRGDHRVARGQRALEALGNYLGMQVYHATQETPGLYTPELPF